MTINNRLPESTLCPSISLSFTILKLDPSLAEKKRDGATIVDEKWLKEEKKQEKKKENSVMQVNTETRVIDKNLVVCRTETKTEKKKKVVKIFWDDKKGKSSPFFSDFD